MPAENLSGASSARTPYAVGHDAIEWRKLALSKLSVADIVNLTEGHTPDPERMVYVNFKATVADYGSWIEYTDAAKRYNFDNVVRDAKACSW